jgi:hypothetical protein
MPDPLFQELFTDTEQLRPAPMAQVQARGRQRARRQRLAVVAAALVMVVPVGAAFALRPDGDRDGAPTVVATAPSAGPTPSVGLTPSVGPTPSSGPTSTRPGTSTAPPSGSTGPSSPGTGSSPAKAKRLTSVPTAALLGADDLGGSGWRIADGGADGDWSLAATLGYCPNARDLEPYGDPRDKRLRSINRGQTRSGVIQEVLLFRAGGAQKYFDYYRLGAAACRKHVSDPGNVEVRVTVVAQGFAGRSLLIRTSSEYGTALFGVVVHGDLASQFEVMDGSETTGRQLVTKARNRLCQAAEAC